MKSLKKFRLKKANRPLNEVKPNSNENGFMKFADDYFSYVDIRDLM